VEFDHEPSLEANSLVGGLGWRKGRPRKMIKFQLISNGIGALCDPGTERNQLIYGGANMIDRFFVCRP
jgi:hypothetical protein